jgi:hypothetical protein
MAIEEAGFLKAFVRLWTKRCCFEAWRPLVKRNPISPLPHGAALHPSEGVGQRIFSDGESCLVE